MEFSKKEIHTSVLTQSKYSQITVDDDFTIPDSKGDMEKIVAKEGHILLESMIPEDGKVRITGSVCVRVLYRTGGDIPRLCQFQSEIPFEDVVNCDGVSSSSQVDCHSQLEDLTVSMINSRRNRSSYGRFERNRKILFIPFTSRGEPCERTDSYYSERRSQ